jgi:hypothetical protein
MRQPHLHKSTIVVGLLGVVALVLIEVPGRMGYGAWGARNPGRLYFEHGWPCVYLRREMVNPAASGAARNRQVYVRSGQSGRWQFRGGLLLWDVLVAACVVGLGTWAWEWRRRRRPNASSFGLAEIMVAMTAAGLVLGWVAYQKGEFEREEALRLGGQEGRSHWLADGTTCVAPRWLQSLTGPAIYPDFLWRPWRATVDVYRAGEEAEAVRTISQLKHLREVYLSGFEPVDYTALGGLDRLECLMVAMPLSAAQLEQISQLRNVRKLVIIGGTPLVESLTKDEVMAGLRKKMPWCDVVDYLDNW